MFDFEFEGSTDKGQMFGQNNECLNCTKMHEKLLPMPHSCLIKVHNHSIKYSNPH